MSQINDIKRLRSNIARRIFLALLTALIPSYIVVLAINWVTIERVGSMTVESIETEAKRHMEHLGDSLSQTLYFLREHIDNIDFHKMVLTHESMDNQRRTDIILNMQARLTIACSAGSHVSDVFILVPALRSTIGSTTYRSSIDMEEYALVSDYSNFWGRNMMLLGERLLICLPLPDLIAPKEPPLYVTTVEINRDALLGSLDTLEAYEGSNVILLNYDHQVMASNTADEVLLRDSMERVAAQQGDGGMAQVGGQNYHVGIYRSDGLDMFLVTYMPRVGIDRMLSKYTMFFGLAILIVISTIIAFSYWEYATLYKPLHMLLKAFSNTGTGRFEGILHTPNDPFYYIYDRYNDMNERLRALVEEVYEKKIQSQHAELRYLQSQINPHMLYNSFFTLFQMAKLNDMDNIMRFSQSLSHYYRLITRIDAPDTTLREEIENAKLFVEINGILHFSDVETEFDALPPEVADMRVPKLIVQPLIENAYKHAMLSQQEGAVVWIRFSMKDGMLYLSVRDNGVGITAERLKELKAAFDSDEQARGEISGLVNVHRRLRLQYGPRYGVVVRSGNGAGFEAVIVLPQNPDNG